MPLRKTLGVQSLFFSAFLAGATALAQPADVLIVNAKVITLDPLLPQAQTLAIRGTRIMVSMAATNCARWRRKSVPVWLREKGCTSPCELRCRAH